MEKVVQNENELAKRCSLLSLRFAIGVCCNKTFREPLINSIWPFIASAAKQSSVLIKRKFLDCRVATLLNDSEGAGDSGISGRANPACPQTGRPADAACAPGSTDPVRRCAHLPAWHRHWRVWPVANGRSRCGRRVARHVPRPVPGAGRRDLAADAAGVPRTSGRPWPAPRSRVRFRPARSRA